MEKFCLFQFYKIKIKKYINYLFYNCMMIFRRTLIGDTQTESRLLHKEDPLAREKIAAFIQEQSKLQDEKAKNKKL